MNDDLTKPARNSCLSNSYLNLDYRYDDATRVVILRPRGDDDGPTFYLTYSEIRKLANIVLPNRESDWEPLQP